MSCASEPCSVDPAVATAAACVVPKPRAIVADPLWSRCDADGLLDVAAGGGLRRGAERVDAVELRDRIARGSDETAAHRRERLVCPQGEERGDGVRRAIRLAGGVRVVGDRHGRSGRGVDDGVVCAAVRGAAAPVAAGVRIQPQVQRVVACALRQRNVRRVHDDTVAGRVGEVGGDEPVCAALRRRGHRAAHPGRVGGDRVGRVTFLQVGETRTVGDQVLHRLDVGRIHCRRVHVAQDAVRHREPDLGAGVAGGADAVLARLALVTDRAGRTGRLGGRHGTDRTEADGGEREGGDGNGQDETATDHGLTPSRSAPLLTHQCRPYA